MAILKEGNLVIPIFEKIFKRPVRQNYSVFLVTTFSTLAFATLGFFGFLNIAHYHQNALGSLELAGAALILINLVSLFIHHRTSFSCHLLIYTILIELLLLLITGGIYNTGIFWFYIFPASAFYLAGRWGGILWILAVTGLSSIVSLLAHNGYITIPYSFITIRQMIFSLLVLSVLIYFFEFNREQAENSEQSLRNALEKSRIQLTKAQKLAHLGSWEWDVASSMFTCSEELSTIFGIQTNEKINSFKDFIAYIHKDDRFRVQNEIKNTVKNFAFLPNLEFRILRTDGSTRYIRSQITTDTTYGNTAHVVGTALDITEEKNLENSVRTHTEELERMNKLMVGRELKMAELKKQLGTLASKKMSSQT